MQVAQHSRVESLDVSEQDELVVLHQPPGRGFYARYGKTLLDYVIAGVVLIVVLPLLIAITIALRASRSKRVLFKQRRVGRDGKPFTVLKFRTMLPERRQDTQATSFEDRRAGHKQNDDPRITGIGRFLRKWSLDELPQLWNVLRGDMSLIGPRPELPWIVDHYRLSEHSRHSVRPGMTGLWQVSARGDRPMDECIEIDLEYAATVSFRKDLGILARTPVAMLGAHRGH
jgi:lipopolysaccharide/colanic/teichoic acid biosynthesis glycosyltransferase